MNQIICGDSLTELKKFPDESVDCCITSPPYWGLRDYGVEGQLGLEKMPEEYVAKMVEVFREVKRVLKKEGTLWLNLGDSYATTKVTSSFRKERPENLKQKDLGGIPWRVAFALQADGWYLRQDIIWHKPNPMPESVTDRCTKSHEYIFLLAKSQKYYFDNDAIREGNANPKRTNYQCGSRPFGENNDRNDNDLSERTKDVIYEGRNKRSVWTVNTNANYYVEFGDKFYKVSPNCPIHSPYLGREIPQSVFCGEQPNQKQNHISGISKNLGQEQVSEFSSILFPDYENPQTKPASGREQISQNISENKNDEISLNKDESQNHHHIVNTEQSPVYNSGSDYHDNSKIAILHNKKSHKNISAKVSDDNVYDKIPCHKSDKKQFDQVFDSDSPYLNFSKAKCLCQEVLVEHLATKSSVWKISTKSFKEAHFAIFPEKLIEPMVLAGCPKEICNKCGKPREKILEPTDEYAKFLGKSWHDHEHDLTMGFGQQTRGFSSRKGNVAGIQRYKNGYSKCNCNAGFNAGIVLDPFIGAGTTAIVAKKLGRNYLGIELNAKYVKMAEERIRRTPTPLL